METKWSLAHASGRAASTLDGFLGESDSVSAAWVDGDGTIREINGAFTRLFGSTVSIHDVVVPGQGHVVADLLSGAGSVWHSVQAGLVRRNREMVDCKIWALAQQGRILVLAEPLRSPGEKLNRLLLELNDELLGARRELAAKNRRLRQLDELKNMFIASATHDLKTPLTSILGYAEMMGEEQLGSEARRMALTIEIAPTGS